MTTAAAAASAAAVAKDGKPRPTITVNARKVDLATTKKAQLDAWRATCLSRLPVAGPKYQVVYADPPWRYANMGNIEGAMGYPTMSLDEIKRLPVPKLCDSTCVLFLWATNPLLPQALEVIKAWGFQYKTVFKVWVKHNAAGTPLVGLGWWSRPSTELLLVAARGSGYTKWKSTHSEPQVFVSRRGRHSEKPAEIRDAVRTFLRVPRRIELFARSTSPGWDAWGLEVPGFLHRDKARPLPR